MLTRMLDFSIKFDNNVILLMIKNIIQREIKARNIIIKIFKEIIIVLKFDIKSSASNKNVSAHLSSTSVNKKLRLKSSLI